jgi:hypothetical protein
MKMKIEGIEGLSPEQIQAEVQRGARFVIYQYCISALIVTFKKPSNIFFIRPGENAVSKGMGFTAISLTLGWWGIPWGPIFTVGSLARNFKGGKDVTQEVMSLMARYPSQPLPISDFQL